MQPRNAVRLAVAWLAAAVGATATAEAGPPKKVATVEGITEYRLDNGARVLLFPDQSAPKVTVNMTVLVGSRHEGYGETGMAHLLEHLVFKGTPRNPDIVGQMKARGAQFNGSTSPDRTNYFETLPESDDNLEFAIALEADRLVNSYVRDEDLKTEFSVVRNEFESGENSPQRVLNQRMTAAAFEWHNYGKSTIGNRSDIERVPIHRLQAFYKKFYQPDNVVVVVAGKIDEKKTLALLNKHFGAIPKPERTLDATYTEEPAQDGERFVTLRRVGDTPSLGIMYHAPAAAHPDSPALQMLGSILSSQPSGRLYKALIDTKMATNVSASSQGMHDPGTFEINAGLPRGGNVDQVRDVILSTTDTVKEHGVTQEEVDRAKRQFLKMREMAAADPNALAVRLSEAIAEGDWRLYFVIRDRVEQVTPEQVREVATKYLTRSNRTVGYFLPTTQPERTPVPPTPDLVAIVDGYQGRAVSDSAESFDVAPMAIEARVQRPGPIEGVKVALLPKKTRGNMVQVHLTLRYGDAETLKGFESAATFLSPLMARATKQMTRQQIQDALDRNVATLGSGGFGGGRGGRRGGGGGGGGGLGSLTFTVETKRANLAPVLEILRQVLREPALPADEFEVMKVQRLAMLERGKTDPQALAANRLERLTRKYPPGDVRYVPTIDESIDRLRNTTIEKVRTLYNDYVGASHGELTVVGDFEPSEVMPLLGRMLSGWKSGKPYVRIEHPYDPGIASVRETIVTPDKENALFVAALSMPVGDEHPDYPALTIGNFILGGGAISSRLGDRLRQKEGLSYGAGSSFNASPTDAEATLTLRAICNPKNLSKAIAAADEELARLLRDGVSEQELADARAGYIRQLEIRRTNDTALAGMLATNLDLGRTMQHDLDLEKSIRRLTSDDVARALRRHVDPKKLVVIGAGDLPADAVK
jgi:zinc protease